MELHQDGESNVAPAAIAAVWPERVELAMACLWDSGMMTWLVSDYSCTLQEVQTEIRGHGAQPSWSLYPRSGLPWTRAPFAGGSSGTETISRSNMRVVGSSVWVVELGTCSRENAC
jgi:hypothetical protein